MTERDANVGSASDLGALVYDQVATWVTDYEVLVKNFEITGRSGKRRIKATIVMRLGVDTGNGPRFYDLTTNDADWSEEGTLTLTLPKRAWSLRDVDE
jgi:hypothetical protein